MIALAIILAIIVAIIGIILFAPITYSFFIDSRNPNSGEIRLSWLYKIVLVHIAYESGKPLFKEIYLLGKLKVGAARDYEDWLNRRVQEETESFHSMEEDSGDVNQEERSLHRDNISDITQSKEQEADETEIVTSVRFNDKGEILDSRLNKKEQGRSKEEDASNLEAKLVELDKFWWWKHITNGDLYADLFTFIKRCYNHSKFRDFHIEGDFGIPDPYTMGIITAAIGTLGADKMKYVTLHYNELVYEGRISNKGRMMLGVLAWYGTILVCRKPMRSLIIEGIQFGWNWNKNRKIKKQLKASQNEV